MGLTFFNIWGKTQKENKIWHVKIKEIQVLVSTNQVALEHSHTHLFYTVYGCFLLHGRAEQWLERPRGLQNVQYLLSGPFFANSRNRNLGWVFMVCTWIVREWGKGTFRKPVEHEQRCWGQWWAQGFGTAGLGCRTGDKGPTFKVVATGGKGQIKRDCFWQIHGVDYQW